MSGTYERARQHASDEMMALVRAQQECRTAEELLGCAHGLEDAVWEIKALANRLRRQEEEAEWSRMMAL